MRIYKLNSYLAWDEGFTVACSQLNLNRLLQASAADTNPPLSYLIIHYWIKLTKSISEPLIRIPSLIASLALICVSYIFSMRLFNKKIAYFTSLMVAISGFNIQYSQFARYVIFASLFATLSVYYFWKYFENMNFKSLCLYLLFSILGLYTNYICIFVNFSQFLFWTVFFKRYKRKCLYFSVTLVIIFICYLPWIIFLSSLKSETSRFLKIIDFPSLIAHLKLFPIFSIPHVFCSFIFGNYYPLKGFYLIVLIGAFLVCCYLFISGLIGIKDVKKNAYLNLIIFTPILITYLWMLIGGLFFFPKYFLFLQPIFFMILLNGVENIKNGILNIFLIILIVSFVLISTYHYYLEINKYDPKSPIDFISKNEKEGDIIILNPSSMSLFFNYYYKGNLKRLEIPSQYKIYRPNYGSLSHDEYLKITGEIKKYKRVWVYARLGFRTRVDPSGKIKRWIDENYKLKTKKDCVFLFVQM